MDVLFFSNAPLVMEREGLYGTGSWASSLVRAININLKDIEVYYAYHDYVIKTIEVSKIDERITIIKIPTQGIKHKVGKLINNWFLRDIYRSSLKNYLSIIEKIQPDIIQIFGFESPFIRLIGNTRIPIVIHIQGLLPPYLFKFYSRFTSFQLLRSVRLKSLLKAQTPLHEKFAAYRHIKLEMGIYPKCQYLIGRTDWDKFITKLLAPHAKYYYCQEIMRESFYKNKWEQNTSNTIKIFTITSEAFYKNVDIIFEVVNLMEKFNSSFKFIWHIAGIDNNDTIVRLMRNKGYKSKQIKFVGRLVAGDLIKEMLQADLFVFPSGIENSPNALQEAMLIGMPIIATHAGGVSSLIEHGQTGILVPEGEPYSLAGAILELKESKEMMIAMGSQARIVAMERNDPKRVVNSLLAVYEDILASYSN